MKNEPFPEARRARRRITAASTAFAALLAACLANSAPASAQVIVLAPPTAAPEIAPPPRAGYAWQDGYWGWQHGRYVWTQGRWIQAPRGAPLPPPPAPAPVLKVMRLPADALFAFDRGDINDILPGGRAQIRSLAAQLRAMPFGRVEVRGYTDRLGSSTYNLGLSQRRADAIKALLVREGVPADRVNARGLGDGDPITQCSDNQAHDRLITCLQADRRVEIVAFARSDERRMPPGPPRPPNAMYRE